MLAFYVKSQEGWMKWKFFDLTGNRSKTLLCTNPLAISLHYTLAFDLIKSKSIFWSPFDPEGYQKLFHPHRILIKLWKKSVASHKKLKDPLNFSTQQSWLLKFNNNFKALNDISQQPLCRFGFILFLYQKKLPFNSNAKFSWWKLWCHK